MGLDLLHPNKDEWTEKQQPDMQSGTGMAFGQASGMAFDNQAPDAILNNQPSGMAFNNQAPNMAYPQQSGMSLNNQMSGTTYPQQSSMAYPQQAGMAYPQQSSMTYPQQSGMVYPQQSGMVYPQTSNMAYQQTPGMALNAPAPGMTLSAPGGMTAVQDAVQPVEQYDIVTDRNQMVSKLAGSDEVEALTGKIEVYNLETIVSFGAEAAEEISKASDTILNNMSMTQLDGSNEMLKTLANIMSKFDIEEIKDDPSFFQKLFGNAKKRLDKVLAKYNTMGGEVDKIYVQLKGYEEEIKQSNKKLAMMFDANVGYYHELVKHIIAGEQGCKELERYIQQKQAELQQTGDNSIQFELTTLNQALMMLEQRTQDLRTAENVAMQSIPMLKTMEFSNYNLIRKINSAFIVTLPVFKQALAQAILLKRQKMQAEAMSELDKKTNEMLLKNAQNTVEVSKVTARLASGSSIQVETLENTWRTITSGIDETRRIQEDARKQRVEDKKRLEVIKEEFNKLAEGKSLQQPAGGMQG